MSVSDVGEFGALLYDADCGFCTRSAGWLRRLRVRCDVLPQRPALLTAWRIDAARARREVPFISPAGHVVWGASAIAASLRTGPWWVRWVGWLISAPGLAWVARFIYQWVARHRMWFSAACATDT